MTWLNPVALIGLLAIAVPIFVHLFGKRVAKKLRFPSLRLLQLATPSASSRRRPSDVLLMVVRCAIVALAALALAQPSWSERAPAGDAIGAMAMIVDTSASMKRLTSTGSTAVGQARDMARALVDSARHGIVIETAWPGENIAAAASWLENRAGLRQLVIVSDFQSGAVHDGDVAHVPEGIGLRLLRIERASPDSSATAEPHRGVIARFGPRETDASWDATAVASTPSDSVTLVVPDTDDPGRVRQAASLNESWQGDVLRSLVSHSLLSHAVPAHPPSQCTGPTMAPLRNAQGDIIASVAATSGPSTRVLVFSCADTGTFSGALLVAAVADATAPVSYFPELEPMLLPDEQLRRWERPPAAVNPGVDGTSPDGRWLWLAALLLLLVEGWIRRRTPHRATSVPAIERRHRVA